MGVDVKRNEHLLSYLNIVASKTIRSENIKHHLARISLMCLDHKTLRFPFTTRRNATSFRKCYDYLSL